MKKIFFLLFVFIAMVAQAQWMDNDRTDAITDERIVDIIGIVDIEADAPDMQLLVLRSSSEGTIEAFVVWGSYFSETEPINVILRIDNDEPFMVTAKADVEGRVLFFTKPTLVVRRILAAKERVVIRAKTYQGLTETVIIKMDGAQPVFDLHKDMFPKPMSEELPIID